MIFENKKNCFLAVVMILLAILIVSLLYMKTTSSASTYERNRTKSVTSILVKNKDTLWDIANRYYTEDYEDMNEFISEIKRTNNLKDDTIHAGSYIVVPYYKDKSL